MKYSQVFDGAVIGALASNVFGLSWYWIAFVLVWAIVSTRLQVSQDGL